MNENNPVTITISGAPGSGKTTIRFLIEHLLAREGCAVEIVASHETAEHTVEQRDDVLRRILVHDVFSSSVRTMPRVRLVEKQTRVRPHSMGSSTEE